MNECYTLQPLRMRTSPGFNDYQRLLARLSRMRWWLHCKRCRSVGCALPHSLRRWQIMAGQFLRDPNPSCHCLKYFAPNGIFCPKYSTGAMIFAPNIFRPVFIFWFHVIVVDDLEYAIESHILLNMWGKKSMLLLAKITTSLYNESSTLLGYSCLYPYSWKIPPGYVKITIEHGPVEIVDIFP